MFATLSRHLFRCSQQGNVVAARQTAACLAPVHHDNTDKYWRLHCTATVGRFSTSTFTSPQENFGAPGDILTNPARGTYHQIDNMLSALPRIWTEQKPPPSFPWPGPGSDPQKIEGTDGRGHTLYENKGQVLWAADKNGANKEEQAILLAIAMQETGFMDGWDYGTENVSCFNINPEMLQGAGCPDSDPQFPKWQSTKYRLRERDNLPEAAGYLLTWLRGKAKNQQPDKNKWTYETLNFLRGGITGYQNKGIFPGRNHPNVDAFDYRNAIATIYKELREAANQRSDEQDLRRFPEANNLYHNNIRVSIVIDVE